MSWLHRSAVLLCACTLALLLAGALVSSTGAGLALPGWPSLARGADPAAAGAGLQQAHRLIAAVVALLAVLVAVLSWRFDPRPWMKGLSVAAVALVVGQAVYGGLAVVALLPAYFSIFHAALAQLFFGLTVAMALFTSAGWLARERDGSPDSDPTLARWALASTIAIYVQVLVGATMRHSYVADGRPGGLAIPDYPLAFGQVVPVAELGSSIVAVAFLHRLIALAAAALVAVTVIRVYRRHAGEAGLLRPASLLALLVVTQIALGGMAVLSGMTPLVTAMHAAAVGVALAASLVLLLRAATPASLLPQPPARATDVTA